MLITGYSRVFASGAFSPADLFGVGDLGGYGDINPDTTGVSVDSAIAQANDESGNGNHLLQGTASLRPLLKQTGEFYYALGDGTDDRLAALDVFGGSGATVFTLGIAGRVATTLNGNRLAGLGAVDVDGQTSQKVHFNPAPDASLRYDGASTSGSLSITADTDYTRVSQRDGATVGDWLDGAENIAPSTSVSLGTTVDDYYLLHLSAAQAGRVYRWFFIDRILTSGERGDLETWLAAGYGGSL